MGSILQAGAALLVGLVQCVLIGWGVWVMRSSSADCAKRNEKISRASAERSRQEDQRHQETMRSLQERHEREAQRHEETTKSFDQTMRSLEDSSEALRAMLRRTDALAFGSMSA